MSVSSFPSIPYPSHVCAPNFVTMKLGATDTYGLWKTQMLCLLESHGMLGFIYGELPSPKGEGKGKEKVEEIEALRKSDALVKGWILGSLSEHTFRNVHNRLRLQTNPSDFTAKDVWDKLESHYNPRALQQAKDKEEEQKRVTREGNIISGDAEYKDNVIETERPEDTEIKESKVQLYVAIIKGRWDFVDHNLIKGKVTLTNKITINGNTALHVLVGTNKNHEILEKMLSLGAQDNPLLDMKNSEGSTLLHVAAIAGNTEAVKILVEKNPKLLFVKDNDGDTPLSKALSNMHSDTFLYLLNLKETRDIEMGTLFSGSSGEELAVNAISAKDFDLAKKLLEEYDILHSDAVLMAIAQNFPSELNSLEKIIYSSTNALPYLIENGCCLKNFDGFNKKNKSLLSQACGVVVCLLSYACIWIIGLLMAIPYILAWLFKFIRVKGVIHRKASGLLWRVCYNIRSNRSKSDHQYYTNPILEATRQNVPKVVETIVFVFPNAIWSINENGHNIIQYAVINRSEKVYNLIYQMSEHKNIYKTIKDSAGNNLLHLAATLAPANKLNLISGAALQIQRELQWFQEVEKFVCPLNIIQKNSYDETPQMVFTREHKELVIVGEKWMKTTAESYTVTAALITTIMFAAAITVPGGSNQNNGIPIFIKCTAFKIFALSDAISLFTSVTSLLMFLSILTARFSEQDFLFKLPTKLIIGLATLFISTTAMIIAFGSTLFLVFGQSESKILIPIAALTCLPITSFVTLQFPLVFDLISATYGRNIFGKKSNKPFY